MTKCTEKEENKSTNIYSYKYNSAGNRTAYEKVSQSETVEKYTYKYNHSNQLISKKEKTDWRRWKHEKTTYEYDEDGNLISESSGKKDTKTYEYIVENHLKAVTTSNEVLMASLYDGDGNRLFTLDYVEDGKDSQKGSLLVQRSLLHGKALKLQVQVLLLWVRSWEICLVCQSQRRILAAQILQGGF